MDMFFGICFAVLLLITVCAFVYALSKADIIKLDGIKKLAFGQAKDILKSGNSTQSKAVNNTDKWKIKFFVQNDLIKESKFDNTHFEKKFSYVIGSENADFVIPDKEDIIGSVRYSSEGKKYIYSSYREIAAYIDENCTAPANNVTLENGTKIYFSQNEYILFEKINGQSKGDNNVGN